MLFLNAANDHCWIMKNFNLIIVCFYFFLAFQVIAKNPAVVTNFSIKSTINDKNELATDYFKEIKINVPASRDLLNEYIFYSTEKVKNLKVTIYDANHQLVRVLKNSEIKDKSAYSHYLYEDDRVKVIKPYHNKFPFYVSYEYTLLADQFIGLPPWVPLSPDNLPVLESSYSLIVPSDYEFNYKFYNCEPDSFSVQTLEDTKKYVWEFKQLNPVKDLKRSTPVRWRMPKGIFVPVKFVYAGMEGSLKSWSTYGSWVSKTLIGIDDISEAESQHIKQLTQECKSEKEVIRVIYNYVLNSTRYVNISIGAGGLVPYPASYVSKNKYGDCKALVNYTHSLLKSVGIESFYSLIMAGSSKPSIDPELVYQTFNHVILSVPIENDTLWLECTPNEDIFGYIGSFIDDKYVLVCCGDNSYLTKTPTSTCRQNRTIIKADIVVDNEQLTAIVKRQLNGISAEYLKYGITNYRDAELDNWLLSRLPYDNYEILDISFNISDSIPAVYEESVITYNNHIIRYDGKLYVEPVHTLLNFSLKDETYKDAGFFVRYNYSKVDTVTYFFPSEYSLENYPTSDTLYSKYGSFTQESFIEENNLQITKSLNLKKGVYTKDEFLGMKNFIETASQLDHQKIILIENAE